ncbi:MAG: hypothetical protein NUW00_04880 [Candidatus Kaiserbacteria bacterium]|nr:hypothetical protein [Candidatus Kaiserbacteria bacterium]MCR4330911.1 hypothetical protein [Patescibacteria group bacterium]
MNRDKAVVFGLVQTALCLDKKSKPFIQIQHVVQREHPVVDHYDHVRDLTEFNVRDFPTSLVKELFHWMNAQKKYRSENDCFVIQVHYENGHRYGSDMGIDMIMSAKVYSS